MVKLEDLHIGDKVKTNISDKDALIVKLESNAYINYQKNLNKEENKYNKALIPFLNDNKTYQGIMYNNVTLKIEGEDMLIGTNISNIIRIIKTDNIQNKANNSLFKKILSLFNRQI